MIQFFLITLLTMTHWSCKESPSHTARMDRGTSPNHSAVISDVRGESEVTEASENKGTAAISVSDLDKNQVEVDTLNSIEHSSVPPDVGQDELENLPQSEEAERPSMSTDSADVSVNVVGTSDTPSSVSSIDKIDNKDAEEVVLQGEVNGISEERPNTNNEIKDESIHESLDVASIHGAWDVMLQANVSSAGVVNYGAIKKSEKKLNEYLDLLSKNVPSKSDKSNKAKAFWANAYNAFTVKLILSNYPTTSIRNIDGGNPWDTKWINLGGSTYSLNNIEHDILRPIWKDARIHFAVNCAAKSCPPIHNEAFTADRIEEQLDKLTQVFINNTKYNQISPATLNVSKIFEWYKEDFGVLTSFIDKYTTVAISKGAKVSYMDYDWALNGK